MGSEMQPLLQLGQGAWFSARQVVAVGIFGQRVVAALLVDTDPRWSIVLNVGPFETDVLHPPHLRRTDWIWWEKGVHCLSLQV